MSTPSASAGTAAFPPVPAGTARTRRALSSAGLVVLAVALVAGCTGQPGAAAIVDGRRISVAEVQQGTRELAPYYSSVDQKSVLILLIGAPSIEAVAEEAGMGVSVQQAQDQLATTAKTAGTSPAPTFGTAAVEVIRFSLAQKALEAAPNAAVLVAKVNDRLTALRPDVNPRYGAVDLSKGAVTDIAYPWLVTPSDASTAASK